MAHGTKEGVVDFVSTTLTNAGFAVKEEGDSLRGLPSEVLIDLEEIVDEALTYGYNEVTASFFLEIGRQSVRKSVERANVLDIQPAINALKAASDNTYEVLRGIRTGVGKRDKTSVAQAAVRIQFTEEA